MPESLSPSRQAQAPPAPGVWAEAFGVERRGIDVRAGLAGGLATSAPLAIGVAAGAPEIGVTACFGGLNAALAVPRGALRERVGWGAGASLACCAVDYRVTRTRSSAPPGARSASWSGWPSPSCGGGSGRRPPAAGLRQAPNGAPDPMRRGSRRGA